MTRKRTPGGRVEITTIEYVGDDQAPEQGEQGALPKLTRDKRPKKEGKLMQLLLESSASCRTDQSLGLGATTSTAIQAGSGPVGATPSAAIEKPTTETPTTSVTGRAPNAIVPLGRRPMLAPIHPPESSTSGGSSIAAEDSTPRLSDKRKKPDN